MFMHLPDDEVDIIRLHLARKDGQQPQSQKTATADDDGHTTSKLFETGHMHRMLHVAMSPPRGFLIPCMSCNPAPWFDAETKKVYEAAYAVPLAHETARSTGRGGVCAILPAKFWYVRILGLLQVQGAGRGRMVHYTASKLERQLHAVYFCPTLEPGVAGRMR